MKEVKREYVVRRNGYYIQESDKEGLYYQVNDINKASTFPTIENTVSYIENDLHLNVANVSINEIKITIETKPLVKVNGVYVYLDTVDKCNVCDGWFKKESLTLYKHAHLGDSELLCEKCLDEIASVYPNVLEAK
jgi:hypothetical protein